MTAEVIYGSELAEKLRKEMQGEVSSLREKGVIPKLTVVIIGEDPASKSYVRGKQKASKEVGVDSNLIELPTTTTQQELLDLIEELNDDSTIHGILVQLPLPDHINEQQIIEAISPLKDVDGFHPINIGRMVAGKDTFYPCTPFGIITMLKSKNIQMEGKKAVVIGRSNIVGKPVGLLLLNENATVTYCHSKTRNMKEYTKEADILIVAVGKEHFLSGDDIKAGAVVIDVGVNRMANGKLTGDVEFESAKDKASYITPVPKGVGPMTITMLLHNTIKSARQFHNL
ncbi:bifunctional methylenetetrahydrofolate dehydrogenase/methenyltetrahydrofolate cyclohydrolase FolD [Aquibacillus halophilus]|uniref:Bifunctional protein FolD n=1 Tax=Aquibacillus halophilus TaxID=930132 RepID=A0A6A8DH46_9BACI|nr:bifunctional methylenetetrahydrofolate dehydrogenase/methenyltetrahydrofolate cyclohydrolase FolD [Aquibacillus halophilus]MRH43169.1 bifunctional methylenetetrahydrofolate dehydrogenase/methenyltetrahydrofolate cyclohydrolase FolD [Aquibacillus halophilus]